MESEDLRPILLVVDDEPAITVMVAARLSKMCRVLTASNGLEALELLARNEVSVIVADERMPEMSGTELLAHASLMKPEVVRVLFTGRADLDAVIRAVNEGHIYLYLTKPWRPDELDTVISTALEHGRLLRERQRLVEELRKTNAELEDRVRERTWELEQRTDDLEAALRTISELARTDPLTGLANRRRLEEVLALEIERARRHRLSLSAVMVDLDRFKDVNDTYGHLVGDRVLQFVASVLTEKTRTCDLVCRYGGEEFLVLLPDTSASQAVVLAERLRLALSQTPPAGMQRAITASLGVAALSLQGPIGSILEPVDAALYRAKANGRNRVECSEPQAAGGAGL